MLQCGISTLLTAASGQNEKFRLFGLMSASAGSSGHNAENAYRRLVHRTGREQVQQKTLKL